MTKLSARERDLLQSTAQTLLDTGALGTQRQLIDVFEYLLKTTLAGRTPKENEIAIEVFGRDSEFNPAEDAAVRVNIHRLRKKLETAKVGQPPEVRRIDLPRGEYRLQLIEMGQTSVSNGKRRSFGKYAIGAIAAVLALVMAAEYLPRLADDRHAVVRQNALWDRLVRTNRPTSVVLGDRIVTFEGDELGTLMMPVASGTALQRLLPILQLPDSSWGAPRVISMTETTADRIKLSNIVYVGLLDTLGELDAPWRAVTQLQYDSAGQLRVRADGQVLDTARTDLERARGSHRDIAYLASLPGPDDTRIVIVSGLDGAGLAQAADIAVSPVLFDAIAREIGTAPDFEAVFEVNAMGSTNLGSSLIYAAPLKTEGMWAKLPTD